MVTRSLIEVAASLAQYGDDQYICARRPWALNSPCVLVPIPEDFRIPEEVTSQGFDYFLEVDVAKEVSEVFDGKNASPQQLVELLIFYAENDAYPGATSDG